MRMRRDRFLVGYEYSSAGKLLEGFVSRSEAATVTGNLT
jgi:hypothetical protein